MDGHEFGTYHYELRKKKSPMSFDPFQDRLSRDIRNDLAAAVIPMLAERDPAHALKAAKPYLDRGLSSCQRHYVEDRLERYRSVLAESAEGDDALRQALILWDHQLFFEVHEVLEKEWYSAEGDEKKTLQAMIRAAGVYIKLEHGYREAARKMADRALPVLQENKELLARYFKPEKLIRALRNLEEVPPLLL
ncbi:MAG: hypothetical protein Kow0089_14800 [Desulfobulbaceae bacterium]